MSKRAWLLGSAAACMLIFWARALVEPAAFDYAEGDTATWIWLLRHGRELYGQLHGLPMQASNYPPLHLRLVAWLAPSDGAILVTGRAIAVAGMVAASATVGWAVWRPTRSRRAAVAAALLYAATLRAGYYAAACRADTVALALSMLGLMLGARRVRLWPLLCALLFTVAILCKHSLVCFPLGLGIWGLRRAPKPTLAMVALTISIGGACVLALGIGAPLFVWSLAPFDWRTFAFYLWSSVLPSAAGLAMVGATLARWPRLSRRARVELEPWVAVFFVGVAWTLALGRQGASSNYLLELLAAITVIASVAAREGLFARLFELHLLLTWLETVAWVACLVFVVLPEARLEQETAARALEGISGPVYAERTWQATATGRAPLVIPFLSTQLAASGAWNPAPFVDELREGRVERVLLGFPLESRVEDDRFHRDRFFADELAALRARYRLIAHAGRLWVYAPR